MTDAVVTQDTVVEQPVVATTEVVAEVASDKPTVIVKDQSGVEVKRFDNVAEAYAFASEEGLQVEIR